jgi:hypothetical protein
MANKKNGPGWDKIKEWFSGSGHGSPNGFGGVNSPGARRGIAGAAAAAIGLGIKARSDKKKDFLRSKGYKDGLNVNGSVAKGIKKNYDRKTMKDEFKSFRKGMSEMKTGGAWTRNSRKHGG